MNEEFQDGPEWQLQTHGATGSGGIAFEMLAVFEMLRASLSQVDHSEPTGVFQVK